MTCSIIAFAVQSQKHLSICMSVLIDNKLFCTQIFSKLHGFSYQMCGRFFQRFLSLKIISLYSLCTLSFAIGQHNQPHCVTKIVHITSYILFTQYIRWMSKFSFIKIVKIKYLQPLSHFPSCHPLNWPLFLSLHNQRCRKNLFYTFSTAFFSKWNV